jgi:hypothetical protein
MSVQIITRRAFLGATAAGIGAIRTAPAAAAITTGNEYHPPDRDNYDFLLARIGNNNPDWEYGPGGDKNFLEQLSHVLRVKVKLQPNVRDEQPENGNPEHFNAVVDLHAIETMRPYPILFMTGMGVFRMGAPQLETLKQYVMEGGFVLMDECASPRLRDDFYQSAYAALLHAFGHEMIRPLPEDHEVYTNVYAIGEPDFRRWKRPGGASPGNTGVFVGDRLAVFLTDADIHCGWTDPRNSWVKRADHEEGIKTGINVVAYALSH